MMSNEHIVDLIGRALFETGKSARQASLEACEREDLVRDIRRGRMPSFDRMLKLFNVLGIKAEYMTSKERKGVSQRTANMMRAALSGEPYYEEDDDPKIESSETLPLTQKNSPEAGFQVDDAPNAAYPYDPDLHDAEHVLVPKLNVRASAGHGAVNEDETAEHLLAFRRDWLRKRGLQADYLSAIEVTGDSMEPTLKEGDTILVDRARPMPPKIGTLVVARINTEEVVVKRLNRLGDKQYLLTSDNPVYHPVALKKDDALVGEVVWRGMWLVRE